MRILNFLFKKPTKFQHHFFGAMEFTENKKDPDNSHYECKYFFITTDKPTILEIAGNSNGPTEKQVEFIKSIQQNYVTISTEMIELIESEFRNWKEDFTIKDFQKEFEVIHLYLPKCESNPIVWEISFETEHDRNHIITLTMAGFEAKEILIDG